MKQLFFLSAILLSGCTLQPQPRSSALPFAELYGKREAQWLNNNYTSLFSGKNDPVNFHETEITGFQNLDAKNQKLYLIVRLCSHQPANAEDGSQMWRLIASLKCPKREIAAELAAMDKKSLKLYAQYLGGSLQQCRENANHYLGHDF